MNKEWIPLVEYALKKNISLSTLRRYIKANKILFRVENGRYLIFDENGHSSSNSNSHTSSVAPATQEFEALTSQLLKAQEEIVELKTLIAFYEATPNA